MYIYAYIHPRWSVGSYIYILYIQGIYMLSEIVQCATNW